MQRRYVQRTLNVEIIRSNNNQPILRMACEEPKPQGTPYLDECRTGLKSTPSNKTNAERITTAKQNGRELSTPKQENLTNNDHTRCSMQRRYVQRTMNVEMRGAKTANVG